MNKKLHLKNLPAAFTLVLFLVVSFFGPEGTLLCFGKDGHVAIEFVDVCNGSGARSQLAGMESDACGSCIDVEFQSSPAHIRKASHFTQPLPMVSLSSVPISLPLKEYSNKYIHPSNDSHHKTLDSLHSVVLLI